MPRHVQWSYILLCKLNNWVIISFLEHFIPMQNKTIQELGSSVFILEQCLPFVKEEPRRGGRDAMGGPPEEQEGGSPTRRGGPPISPRPTRRGYPGVIAWSPPLLGSSCPPHPSLCHPSPRSPSLSQVSGDFANDMGLTKLR